MRVMSKNKLKFYLNKTHKKISFQIVEQELSDEVIEWLKSNSRFERDSNKVVKIKIDQHPAIYDAARGCNIFLRGNHKDKDFKETHLKFHSNDRRDLIYDEIIEEIKRLTSIISK